MIRGFSPAASQGPKAERVIEVAVGEDHAVERCVGLLSDLAEYRFARLLHPGVDEEQPLRGFEGDEIDVVGRHEERLRRHVARFVPAREEALEDAAADGAIDVVGIVDDVLTH